MRRVLVTAIASMLVASVVPARAALTGGSENVRHVTTLKYGGRYNEKTPFGTDIEFARIKGRDYAFAGTYRNGLQVVDITNPRSPRITAVYDCAIAQGDVQVFRRGSRTIVAYAADDYSSSTFPESRCFRDNDLPSKTYGTFFVDVTEPSRPRSAGFAEIAVGSHNQTVHPGGLYMYNSNADLAPNGTIEVLDIRKLDHPTQVAQLPLATGLDSHDITFSADGKRAYSAALTHTLVLDTSRPSDPKIIGRIIDPTITIHHQADPITVDDPILGKRTFLIVTDELAGAAGNASCPGGGLHVFEITGALERSPVKVGYWTIPDTSPAIDDWLVCTSHVLRLYPKQKLMTIGWYDAGVRIVDVSGLVGVSVGAIPQVGNVGAGMREIGFYAAENADTWAAKTNRFEKDGSFYLFGNDINRGLDVYRYDAKAPKTSMPGVWMTPDEARAALPVQRFGSVPSFAPFCVVLPRALST